MAVFWVRGLLTLVTVDTRDQLFSKIFGCAFVNRNQNIVPLHR